MKSEYYLCDELNELLAQNVDCYYSSDFHELMINFLELNEYQVKYHAETSKDIVEILKGQNISREIVQILDRATVFWDKHWEN